ncbi:unnamed protein product [Rotaria socialis]|uniref:Uncharacterized protein n=1 Tax=Rotaria socialis TaxID=392032 RepID=A0A817VYU0_9BILA|nr:unnamed protein product [Rotaria socialis]CAF3544137.1 unnamed protein product [Rotaria socialis]CAF4427579.1 unnamed protein product [Rotaria socialis]
MVCFVHDHHFRSKFHAAINQLRKTNEFSILTLRQLPKQCCSCPEKRNNVISAAATESVLTSMDINELRLICLQLDLKQYVITNVLSSSSKILHYTVLSFPTVLNKKIATTISNQFILQQDKEHLALEKLHHVALQFITSNTSKELLDEVVQIKYNLVAKCSNFFEALQAIHGLWVIISTEDLSRVDIIKHVLQQQWHRFIQNTYIHPTYDFYNWRVDLPRKTNKNKCSNLKQSRTLHQTKLNKRFKKSSITLRQQEIVQTIEDENDLVDDYLLDEILMTNNQRLKFLWNRYENSCKSKRSRTHRQQHLLAIAMVA